MIKKILYKSKFIHGSLKQMHEIYWKLLMKFFNLLPENFGAEVTNKLYAIGIVTYVERYESYFKPLLVNLVKLFPDTQFVISLNGFHDIAKQRSYLAKAKAFLSKYENVKVLDFEEAQSLSKLWNLTVVNADTEKVFVLNDDLRISLSFRRELERSGIINTDISLINRSWSHFLISKQIIDQVGWFDERFPAMGNEDEDYECRMALEGISRGVFKMKSVQNVIAVPETYSFGHEIELVNTKYVRANKIFFDSKWEISPTPKNGFIYVDMLDGYVKLRAGMETPNFYDK